MARRINVLTDKSIRRVDFKNKVPFWAQSTAYVVGDLVIAPVDITSGAYLANADGQVWRCITAHTSGSAEAKDKDWYDDRANWTRSEASVDVRAGTLSDKKLTVSPTGESTLIAGAFYQKGEGNIGSKLAAAATLWDQATAYEIGDVRTEPTTGAASKSTKQYRCLVGHTSTNSGTKAADFATDLAASKWAQLTAGLPSTLTVYDQQANVLGYRTPTTGGIEGEPNIVGKKDIVTVTHGTSGKILKQDTGETLGYTMSNDRPMTDAILDDLDERLQPDPTKSAEQLIYIYEDIYGNQLRYTSAQTITSPIARLIGVTKE
jgi:hypothetical protein